MVDATDRFLSPDISPPERPRPLRTVAASVAKVTASVGGVLTALVGWGVLTAAQGDAVTGLLGLLPGLVAAATSVWSSFRTASSGEAHVTPLADPRVWIGGVLARLTPDLDQPRRN